MPNQIDFIEMKFPAKSDYVGVVRLTASGIANRMGFTYEDIEDIKVAISEAVTNAVVHAYEDEGEITIGFGVYAERVEVMVADHGGSFNLEDIRGDIGPYKNREKAENLREGGFGLFLINALMDKVEISSNSGVIILMTKYLQKIEEGLDDQISSTL